MSVVLDADPDAGTVPPDGSLALADAAESADAAEGAGDASALMADAVAAVSDAAPTAADSGAVSPTAQGCGCLASGGDRAPGAVLLVLMLALTRRRKPGSDFAQRLGPAQDAAKASRAK
jgi:MYXO-CTERM domain-containing protein